MLVALSLPDTGRKNPAFGRCEEKGGRKAWEADKEGQPDGCRIGVNTTMKTSKATNEIREIRDRLSLHLMTLTPEERNRESEESMKKFAEVMGRPIEVVDYSRSGMAGKEEPAQKGIK